jgi:hypothetical protein
VSNKSEALTSAQIDGLARYQPDAGMGERRLPWLSGQSIMMRRVRQLDACKNGVERMLRQRYAITITAPKDHVWKTMLDDATFREWASAFNPGTYFEGSWEQGSEIRFLGPDPETGKLAGMCSRVHESRPYEFVSIEHVGFIEDGKVDTTSDLVKQWAPAYENYTFQDKDGGTEVLVDLDVLEDFLPFYEDAWPKALRNLKALAER